VIAAETLVAGIGEKLVIALRGEAGMVSAMQSEARSGVAMMRRAILSASTTVRRSPSSARKLG